MDTKTTETPHHRMALRGQRGFALSLQLSLLPLLLTALLGAAAFIPLFSKLSRAEDECRASTLASQALLLVGLERLTKMSAVSEKLADMEQKALQMVRSSALNPPALQAALTLLNIVRSSQRALNLAQAATLRSSELASWSRLAKASTDMSQSQKHLGSTYLAAPFRPVRPRLQVEKFQRGSSDLYRISKDFEQTQRVSGSWQMRLLPHFERWTEAFFPRFRNLLLQCASGVQKKGETLWEPTLLGVKRQLKSFGS